MGGIFVERSEIKMLFALLGSALSGEKLSDELLNEYSPDCLPKLIKVATKHDLAHMLAVGLKNNDLLDNPDAEKTIFKAIYRYELIKHAYEKLCTAFEKAEIPYIPLKGSVMRQYYREPWMRTSCDIDVLVKEEDLDRAVEVLTTEHGYKYGSKGPHDVSLYADNGVHLELHYTLIEEDSVKNSSAVLKDVWETSSEREGYNFFHDMSDEMFYFYHISHMAKHFTVGGCGIRMFIDLWMLDRVDGYSQEARDALIRRGGLLKFADAIRALAHVWFDGAEHTELSENLEDFILRGGTYGIRENFVSVEQVKRGGRIGYMLARIFLPYDTIKFHYPILQKYRFLTPVMQVRIWFKLIFCGHLGRVVTEINYNNHVANKDEKNTRYLLDNMGL